MVSTPVIHVITLTKDRRSNHRATSPTVTMTMKTIIHVMCYQWPDCVVRHSAFSAGGPTKSRRRLARPVPAACERSSRRGSDARLHQSQHPTKQVPLQTQSQPMTTKLRSQSPALRDRLHRHRHILQNFPLFPNFHSPSPFPSSPLKTRSPLSE